MEQIRPISKAIYKKAKSLGIKTITLQFNGGSDEGVLEVWFDLDKTYKTYKVSNPKFEKQVYDWAWGAYQYSGDSNGYCGDYTDDITYDLQTNLVSSKYQRNIEVCDVDIEFEPTVKKKKKTKT